MMRIAIASFVQETDSFSPLPTTLDDFHHMGLYIGDDLLERSRGGGPIGGLLAVAEEEAPDMVPVPIVSGTAMAGGPVTEEVIAFFEQHLVQGLRRALPLDGVFLFLHGAAASERIDDVSGYLLTAVRAAVGERVPIVVPCDHHANITARFMAAADIVVGYQTQPHDPFETGQRAARLLFRLARRTIAPTMAWVKIPLITHQEQFLTDRGPMKAWFDLAREIETRPGVLSASTFPMQPWLDVAEGGWTAVVITDDDLSLARRLAAELANKAWTLRDAFLVMTSIPVEEAIRRAVAAPRGLVVLSDTGDSVFGGAPGDSTCILGEMLRQGLHTAGAAHTALVPMVDPEAAAQATAAGVGREITVRLGGKYDHLFSRPLEITARVAGLAEGRLQTSPVALDAYDMGPSALLELGTIKIVVSTYRGISGNHPAVYRRFGIEPAEAKMAVLKTASNFQAYRSMTSEVLRVDTPGLTSSHLEQFTWRRLPRPIYPLDPLPDWQALP